jgi:hypothetical protein
MELGKTQATNYVRNLQLIKTNRLERLEQSDADDWFEWLRRERIVAAVDGVDLPRQQLHTRHLCSRYSAGEVALRTKCLEKHPAVNCAIERMSDSIQECTPKPSHAEAIMGGRFDVGRWLRCVLSARHPGSEESA